MATWTLNVPLRTEDLMAPGTTDIVVMEAPYYELSYADGTKTYVSKDHLENLLGPPQNP